jgi:DNA-binding ferritin-like protein
VLSKKRFLLNEEFKIENIKQRYKESKLTEFFTYAGRCKYVLYQKDNDEYYKVTILSNGIKRTQKIDRDNFYKKSKKAISDTIYKNVIKFSDNLKIDIFLKKNKGLVILSTSSENDIKDFKKYIKSDVTNMKNYSDIYISFYGNPLKNENIYDLIKKLKVEKIDMKDVIKKYMPLDSAVRIKLYQLYISLEKNRFDLLKNDNNRVNNLISYREKLMAIVDILKEYGKCFEKDLVEKLKENLQYILLKVDIDGESSSIKKNLFLYKECMNSDSFMEFLKNKDRKITNDIEKLIFFMQTREYSIIIKQLELLVKESSVEHEDEEYITIKEALRNSFKKRYKKLNKKIKEYIDCDDEESYKKIFSILTKLKNINKEFGFLNKKRYLDRKNLIFAVENDIVLLLENIKNIDIIKASIKDENEIKCLVKNFEKKRLKILKKLKKDIKILEKEKDLFIS